MKPNVIAYTALRYGKDYLESAIRSIIDGVDSYYVLYATQPSHGHASNLPPPESEDELHEIAWSAAGTKLRWVRGDWTHEGQQRDSITQHAPDADLIVSLDYDEIWQPDLFDYAIQTAWLSDVRYWRVPFRHYFRSFYKCILYDPAYPVRVIRPHASLITETLQTSAAINHFGYAITPKLMRSKWEIHGHKSELRRDVNFFTDIYEANRQYDTHPVGSEYWNPESVNPFLEGWLPEWMKEHPYANMEVIE